MSQQKNPFNFDLASMINADPQRLMDDWRRALEAAQVPGVDMAAILESQRKNVEAVTDANRLAMEGIQAVLKRQSELMQQSMAEATRMMQQFDPAQDPGERLARQTELTREAFETALANMKELAEMASHSQAEALQKIQARFNESLAELKSQVMKLQK